MVYSGQTLVFDTSAINALCDDEDVNSIVTRIGKSYDVSITETVLEEVIADPEEGERRRLLELVGRFLHSGCCIMPFHWIIEHQAKAYWGDRCCYAWRNVDVRFLEAEREIREQSVIHGLSGQTKKHNKAADEEYCAIFSRARPRFQRLFTRDKERPPLQDFVQHLLSPGGAYLSWAADLMKRATGSRPSETEAKEFIDRCPPFNALLVALGISQYDRCVREDGKCWVGRAGRNDMFSAVYLPYCHVFVTNDLGQKKALQEVVNLTALPTVILMHGEFKSTLFGSRTGP